MGLPGVDEGLFPRALKDHVNGVDASRSQVVDAGLDVAHLEREVVDPLATTVQERGQEPALSNRLHKLDLHPVGVAVLDEAKALVGNVHAPDELTTEDVAEHERPGFRLANSDRHVIEPLRECQCGLTSRTQGVHSSARSAARDTVSDGDDIDPGKTQSRKVDLTRPGTYVLVCNLPGYFKAGMYTTVTVQ